MGALEIRSAKPFPIFFENEKKKFVQGFMGMNYLGMGMEF